MCPAVRDAIRAGKRVVASVAPSFPVAMEVDTIEDMRDTLKKLGFADAEETAVGAELVSRAYEPFMRKDTGVMISSCCPAVNSLMEKYYPDLLSHLLPVKTPMIAHCDVLKSAIRTPSPSLSAPASPRSARRMNPPALDACLTFEELSAWMAEEGRGPGAPP